MTAELTPEKLAALRAAAERAQGGDRYVPIKRQLLLLADLSALADPETVKALVDGYGAALARIAELERALTIAARRRDDPPI
ncbi:MAG: hypothetical protein HYU75_05575 [Betaproteobacteria bacterium]|nr:hypothetical protein [Betaproteobacteria bacterium]